MKKYNSEMPSKFPDDLEAEEEAESRQEVSNGQNQDQQQKYNYFQTLLQNYLLQSQNPQAIPNNRINENLSCQNHSCSDGMIASLFGVIQSQTQELEMLNKKVQQILKQNKDLVLKVRILEAENIMLKSADRKREDVDMNWKEPINEIKIQGESVNRETLLDILFGKQKYEYQLRLAEPLDKPLYRQRNFSIIMQLVDLNNQPVQNSNKIPMSLALYTCENPPKFIEKNTAGQKMLKGYVDQALIQGTCHFEKVQIRQVTSHYRSGWIFLVAIPCMTPLGANKSENFIDFTKIKPLVIDEVIVKAKKPKKKDEKKEESDDGM